MFLLISSKINWLGTIYTPYNFILYLYCPTCLGSDGAIVIEMVLVESRNMSEKVYCKMTMRVQLYLVITTWVSATFDL
jgi:hypothetical protein